MPTQTLPGMSQSHRAPGCLRWRETTRSGIPLIIGVAEKRLRHPGVVTRLAEWVTSVT